MGFNWYPSSCKETCQLCCFSALTHTHRVSFTVNFNVICIGSRGGAGGCLSVRYSLISKFRTHCPLFFLLPSIWINIGSHEVHAGQNSSSALTSYVSVQRMMCKFIVIQFRSIYTPV